MDYEKAYKEAVERMKSWANGEHPDCFSEAQKAAEFVFPELKQTEYEKTRKELMAVIKDLVLPGEQQAKFINWLEYQEDKDKLIKELGEYKVKYTQEVIGKYLDQESNLHYLKNNELDVSDIIIELVDDDKQLSPDEKDYIINWFESLKKTGRKEWSEEDEAFRNLLIDIIRVEHPNGVFTINETDIPIFKSNDVTDKRIINWLKSLGSIDNTYDKGYRDGFSAAKFNAWKPNKKQMKALKWAIDSCAVNTWMYKGFESLYNDIDKLRKD